MGGCLKMSNEEFEILQKENEEIRESINKEVLQEAGNKEAWLRINELVENEILQERFCGE